MQPVRAVIVGYGLGGRMFHAPPMLATAGMALHGVVSSDAGKVHRDHPGLRVYPSLADALADGDVELVVVTTPNRHHAEMAHAALDAGKHVVVDKPFTATLAEAQGLAARAARGGPLLAVYQNRRWDGDFLTLRALLAAGVLGEVVQFESHYDRFRPEVQDRWREQAGAGSGIWFDLGAHVLDQALVLFGAPDGMVADVTAQRTGAEVDDYFHVVLRYGRMRAILHGGSLVTECDLRFAVHGTLGSLVATGAPGDGGAMRLTLWEDGQAVARDVPVQPTRVDGFYGGMRDAIRHGAPVPVTSGEALRCMELLVAALG